MDEEGQTSSQLQQEEWLWVLGQSRFGDLPFLVLHAVALPQRDVVPNFSRYITYNLPFLSHSIFISFHYYLFWTRTTFI